MEQCDLPIRIHQEQHWRQSVCQPEQHRGANWFVFHIIARCVEIIGHKERNQIKREIGQEFLHSQFCQAIELNFPKSWADRKELLTKRDNEVNSKQRDKAQKENL